MSLKFCPKCGNKLEPDASFCNACGADLKIITETSDASPPKLVQTTQEPKLKPQTIIYADFLKRVIAIFFSEKVIWF